MATVVDRVLTAPASLRGTISLPSDKSIAHRALICAALAEGESHVRLNEPGDDILSTMAAVNVIRDGGGVADCGNSGTTMRLLTGAIAAIPGTFELAGDESLSRRPME